jgi:hypothetical protein
MPGYDEVHSPSRYFALFSFVAWEAFVFLLFFAFCPVVLKSCFLFFCPFLLMSWSPQ